MRKLDKTYCIVLTGRESEILQKNAFAQDFFWVESGKAHQDIKKVNIPCTLIFPPGKRIQYVANTKPSPQLKASYDELTTKDIIPINNSIKKGDLLRIVTEAFMMGVQVGQKNPGSIEEREFKRMRDGLLKSLVEHNVKNLHK